jgi:hypothetical protein
MVELFRVLTTVFELVKKSLPPLSGTQCLSLLLPVGEKGGMRGLGRCDSETS